MCTETVPGAKLRHLAASGYGALTMLILCYDTIWRQPITGEPAANVEITADRRRFDGADAVAFNIPEWPARRIEPVLPWWWELLPKKRRGQLWIGCSLECEEHYPLLRENRFMRHFDMTMTYRLASHIPVTYVDPQGDVEQMVSAFRRPPSRKRQDTLLASFVSSGFNQSGREAYLHELARHMAIDSYGKFMRNRTIAPDLGRPSKLEAISNYRFTIAFENACSPDYVTEKFFDPFWAGSIPVYLGAPNVEDFAPGDHCFINAADFPDPAALARHLTSVASDEAAYRSYFAWKERPFRKGFEWLLALETHHPLERLCAAVAARLN